MKEGEVQITLPEASMDDEILAILQIKAVLDGLANQGMKNRVLGCIMARENSNALADELDKIKFK